MVKRVLVVDLTRQLSWSDLNCELTDEIPISPIYPAKIIVEDDGGVVRKAKAYVVTVIYNTYDDVPETIALDAENCDLYRLYPYEFDEIVWLLYPDMVAKYMEPQ